MYYSGLSRLDASMAQLLNGMYLISVMLLVRLGGQALGWRTGLRAVMAMFGLLLITGGVRGQVDWMGVGLMLGNALLFAGTVTLSQRVLYEMPARTVTLYVMTVMTSVVVMARLAYAVRWVPQTTDAMWAILALSVSTALSRLTLFAGVKNLGSLQTALLAITEIAVAMGLSYVFLDERLNLVQWIAFTHAFGDSGISQDELDAIRRMMGVEGPLPSEPPLKFPLAATQEADRVIAPDEPAE
jgi:drug/metabolite transporter (DMT)-like permease